MIDVRSHILWDEEGRTVSYDMALARLQQASRFGIDDVIATPYVTYGQEAIPWQGILKRTETLQQLAKEAGCSIRVHAGAELELNGHIWEFLQEDSSRYCLAGSHYILVALPRFSYVSQLESDLYRLMLQGFLPIIAQAEQSLLCMDNPQQLLEWMHHGVMLQCDLGSFNGDFGEKIRKLSQQLAGHRMITFWGSGQLDSADLPKAIQAAEQSFSVADSQWDGWQQCSINSEKLLRDKFFYPILPEFWKKRRMGILSRLFGI